KYKNPYILQEYLVNHCKRCSKKLGLYYASIVRRDKEKHKLENEYISSESDEPPLKNPNK
ncbi:4072_t:CDS:1, partial [Funneliformis caledonium]